MKPCSICYQPGQTYESECHCPSDLPWSDISDLEKAYAALKADTDELVEALEYAVSWIPSTSDAATTKRVWCEQILEKWRSK